MAVPPDPEAVDTAEWIIRHLWAPLVAVLAAGMGTIWSMLNSRINHKASRDELNGLGERVSRNELELERRRTDIKELFAENDKLADRIDSKVDQIRAEMQTGFRDLSTLITSHITRNGNGK